LMALKNIGEVSQTAMKLMSGRLCTSVHHQNIW